MLKYYIRLLRAAFGRAALGDTIGRMDLWSGVAAAIGAVIAHYLPKQEGDYVNSLLWQIPLWVFTAVIAVRIARAPYLLDKQAHDEIGTLRLTLDNKTARQAALDLLWALRKEGVALRNQPINEAERVPWLNAYQTWRGRVYSAAEVVSPNLRNHLETLNEVGPIPQGITVNGTLHIDGLKVMSEIMRRLERYLEKDL